MLGSVLLLVLALTACRTAPPAPSPAPPVASPPETPGTPVGQNPPSPPVGQNPPGGGQPACTPGQAAAYFPYQVGTQAAYAGLGNEYASYKVNVVHQAGNKVEWRRDNGGTVMAEVVQVAPQQVVRIYREGEAYDNTPRLNAPPNDNEPILQGPIQVGTQWTAGNITYTITSVNSTVQALNQSLTCVVVVDAQSPTSLNRTYYHQQYGLVLSIFDPNGSPVESRLSTFTP